MEMPDLHLTSVTISCPRPRALAEFYAGLLGAVTVPAEPEDPLDPEEWTQVELTGFRLNFEYERVWSAPVWPAVPGSQTATQHLDIQVRDLVAATRWAVECGVTVAEVQPQDDVRVLLDPSGHPFCLYL